MRSGIILEWIKVTLFARTRGFVFSINLLTCSVLLFQEFKLCKVHLNHPSCDDLLTTLPIPHQHVSFFLLYKLCYCVCFTTCCHESCKRCRWLSFQQWIHLWTFSLFPSLNPFLFYCISLYNIQDITCIVTHDSSNKVEFL